MTIKNAFKEITRISDDSLYNYRNYMSALPFIDLLYSFMYKINEFIDADELIYLPSYKDINVSQELKISSTDYENTFGIIRAKTVRGLDDDTKATLLGSMLDVCYDIIFLENNIIEFYLNGER